MPMSLGIGLGLGMGGGVASAAAWAPSNLGSSLYAFWDAEATANITLATTKVSAWVDSTANAYILAQGTDANRPTYGATAFNGRPGITLVKASSTFMNRTGLGSLPINADPCDIWMLMDQTALVGDTSIMSLLEYGSSSNAFRRVERTVSAGVNRGGGRIGTGASATALTNATVDFSGKHVLRLRIGGTSSQTDIDGTAGSGSAITPASAAGNIIIGRTNSGSSAADGIINAILITAPLTGTDESNLLAYLNARAA